MYFVQPNILIISIPLRIDGSGNALQTPIPTQQQLIDHRVLSIGTLCSLDQANDPFNPANTVITPALLTALSLTLYKNDVQTNNPGLWYDQIPFSMFRSMQNYNATLGNLPSSNLFPFIMNPSYISWEKCFISAPPLTAVAANTSVLLSVTYLDKGDDGQAYYQHLKGMK
jgi:hypothetical protein